MALGKAYLGGANNIRVISTLFLGVGSVCKRGWLPSADSSHSCFSVFHLVVPNSVWWLYHSGPALTGLGPRPIPTVKDGACVWKLLMKNV